MPCELRARRLVQWVKINLSTCAKWHSICPKSNGVLLASNPWLDAASFSMSTAVGLFPYINLCRFKETDLQHKTTSDLLWRMVSTAISLSLQMGPKQSIVSPGSKRSGVASSQCHPIDISLCSLSTRDVIFQLFPTDFFSSGWDGNHGVKV